MSTISDWTGKAMRGSQQGWAQVTVPMAGTAKLTSLGGYRPASSLAAPANRKTPFLPTPRPTGWGGAAVFQFNTGCLQP
ncbi:hypothetical protein GCM10027214_16370 [Stenotrophomonas tumulicola]